MAMLLEMRNISKSFPGVKALNGFSIDLKAGEVHALVGENGAGKSTLIKTLYGIHQPDGGEIVIDGDTTTLERLLEDYDDESVIEEGRKTLHISVPSKSIDITVDKKQGELSVCPHLDIANNIFLGCIKNKHGVIDDRFAHEEAARLMEEAVGLRIPSDTPMKDLSIADQQMVEITKVTSKGCRIVVFDEPTSSLTENEIERLFKIIFALKKKGVGIIYISHRLEELPVIADRITVMRDGTRVKTMDYKDTNDNEIISLMVGRELSNIYPTYKRTIGEVVFEADNIRQGTKHQKGRHIRQGTYPSLQPQQTVYPPAQQQQNQRNDQRAGYRSKGCLSMCQREMKGFQHIALEHIKIYKTKQRKKKTAYSNHDACSLLIKCICVITHTISIQSFTRFNTTAERAGTYSFSHSFLSFA